MTASARGLNNDCRNINEQTRNILFTFSNLSEVFYNKIAEKM